MKNKDYSSHDVNYKNKIKEYSPTRRKLKMKIKIIVENEKYGKLMNIRPNGVYG
jgi:hypothetical protein